MIPARQLWGLAVRCERAIRDISPHCHLQKAVRGEASHLQEDIAELLANAAVDLVKLDTLPPLVETALGRLLVSSAASALKASQLPGMKLAGRSCSLKVIGRLHRRLASRGWAPALSALLIPRVAAAMNICSGPTALAEVAWALAEVSGERLVHDLQDDHHLRVLTSCHVSALAHQVVAHIRRPAPHLMREASHIVVGVLSNHAISIADSVVYTARSVEGCDGTPATSGSLLEWLVHPLLHLIHSPLLDLLAVMQHVPVEASAEIRTWHCLSASIPPVYVLPLSVEPDAAGACVAMQVGRWVGGR